jgi:aminoglycoside phosphotransferase (APT) family kinase protein
MPEPIVRDAAAAEELEHGAAVVLDPLRDFLDAAGVGTGELTATEIGDGHSNLTFLLRRGVGCWVLRRPPRGELAASANDVLREAQVLEALAGTDVPVPAVLARCEDPDVIGAPFFVMTFVEGGPVNDALPPGLNSPTAPQEIAAEVVAAVVDLHAADLAATGLDSFGRPSGYLERQIRRFGALLAQNATRPLPDLLRVGEWLEQTRPESTETTFVHGDFRLGNLMFAAAPLRLTGVLDWEMATVGDPLADLGYLTAMWAHPDDPASPMFALSRATTRPGFPDRDEIARAYAERTGRSLVNLTWYQVMALWKAGVFLEGSYRRYRDGASNDAYFATLEQGVPLLAATALSWAGRAGGEPLR